MSSLAKQKQEKQRNGYLFTFLVCLPRLRFYLSAVPRH